MKNRFMITISDIHGSRQYTVHQLIRRLALWMAVIIVVVFAIGAILLKILTSKVDELDALTKNLKQTQLSLVEENNRLQMTKKMLLQNILDKSNELESMNEQLSEIERIVGLKPDIGDAFDERAEAVKQKTLHNLQAAKLTIAELALLNRSVPTGMPLKRYKRISDGFGYRIHPVTHRRTFHFGLDFAADTGTPVYATADGVVSYARTNGGYGKYMLVLHPFGFSTAYGHLSRYAVKEGTYVYKGDLIGYVGNSGRSTGPHLHYEVRYLHKWLNPASFIHWSEKTYRKVMRKERLVDWKKLIEQLHERYIASNPGEFTAQK